MLWGEQDCRTYNSLQGGYNVVVYKKKSISQGILLSLVTQNTNKLYSSESTEFNENNYNVLTGQPRQNNQSTVLSRIELITYYQCQTSVTIMATLINTSLRLATLE